MQNIQAQVIKSYTYRNFKIVKLIPTHVKLIELRKIWADMSSAFAAREIKHYCLEILNCWGIEDIDQPVRERRVGRMTAHWRNNKYISW